MLAGRLRSIDTLRGAVMVLMALDHVRVYAGIPAGGPTPDIFFTRWVTHFCAPAFVFLAGSSAFLRGRRLAGKAELARWLALRGLWLVLLELTVLRLAWTFNFDYAHYVLAGVIWAIGWCMVLLAALVFLPLPAVAALGVTIIALHNGIGQAAAAAAQSSSCAWLWRILYYGGPVPLGSGEQASTLAVLYSLVPWVGVMAIGYAFGAVLELEPRRRRRICLALGTGATLAFLVLRSVDLYGDPRPWRPRPSAGQTSAASDSTPARTATLSPPPAPRPHMTPVLSFLNTTKYPASLLFLLMTLGPILIALGLLDDRGSSLPVSLDVFGRVPFFFYVLHIPLIHLLFVVLAMVRYGHVIPWLTDNQPMMAADPPTGYAYSLPALYALTLLVVAMLYVPCRRFAELKSQHPTGWTSYL